MNFFQALISILSVYNMVPATATLCASTGGVFTGTITLASQAEVNSAISCTRFTGNVWIKDDNDAVDDIVDLSPLDNVQVIDGYLNIGMSWF